MATSARTTTRFRPWRVTVATYRGMIAAGLVHERDRVFLWKGRLLVKMTKGRPHTLTSLRLIEALRQVVPGTHYLEQEQPVALVGRQDTLPEPDLMVVRGKADDYPETPTTAAVALIVEVSDSTLRFDLGPKQRVYAAESIPCYWVASVEGHWIEVFTRPSGPQGPAGYLSRTIYRAGERVPVALDGNPVGSVAVDEVFP